MFNLRSFFIVETTTFMGGACGDSRDHADPPRLPMPVSDPRQDTDTTEPNAPRCMMIYLARWKKKTNKQTKTDGSFPFYSAVTRTRNKRIL